METHTRTIIKSLTWRTGGLLLTMVMAWAITRRVDLAATIGVADTAVKIVVYYLHERMWLKIRFGQIDKPRVAMISLNAHNGNPEAPVQGEF